jgi:type I restriction enzyme R subunit
MTIKVAESTIEEAVLEWLGALEYSVIFGPTIAPGEPDAERDDYGQVVLERRLRQALQKLNPSVPEDALDEAFRKLTRPDSPSLTANNRAFHKSLTDGLTVEYRDAEGRIVNAPAKIIEFDNIDENDWLAVNQFTVVEGQINRRPDVVIFINGLPLAVIELKNPADEKATIHSAFNQLQTYKAQIPSLFTYNEALVVSDGLEARIGTLTAGSEWFMPWRTISGETLAPETMLELEVLIKGVFDKARFLELVRRFIVFEDRGGGNLIKKLAGYHQFHAVRAAVEETVRARSMEKESWAVHEEQGSYLAQKQPGGKPGDRRIGVVWHTQGSGKSLTMVFYTGAIVVNTDMQNPTVVVLTDRNDLDGQLFGTFSRCNDILRQAPRQATSRAHLRELLQVASGGIVFSTIQKFLPFEEEDKHPVLSDRGNIVVIADEAHRSQYDFVDGFASHMRDALPNASFIGFTGTPIELKDANTRAVFGDYISVYDIQRAVQDKATVPIYYESRLAKIELNEAEKPKIDPDFEEATEGEEIDGKEKLKRKWAALEAVVGAEKRVRLIAEDMVSHFEKRLEALDGKAMIVCMSRRICIEMYKAIAALRPDWHDDDDLKGNIKIVMTGSASDPVGWQQHIRNKQRREKLAERFKDPEDAFNVVIVRDMWLTGFDAPSLHTMYIDKPMRGHGLMQAIARVNRVFKDKPGGRVVDYIGIADDLKKALAVYTESGGKGSTAIDQEAAVAVMQEKYEICCGMMHGFDWSRAKTEGPSGILALLPAAQQHILAQDDGKARFIRSVTELSQAFALAVPHEDALAIREDLMFFQYVRAALAKKIGEGRKSPDDLDAAIRQIISRAVSSDEVVDIFAAAGLKKPDISILSDEFLEEVRGMPYRNLAVELLQKLLSGEIRGQRKKNLVRARSFAEMLEKAVKAYQNRAIETAQVIEELIALAKQMREADRKGHELGLTDDEVAFYDALETNDSAVAVLGDDTLKLIARELVATVKRNVTIDWAVRENVRAKMRVMVRRILRKHGYPPDKQEKATQTVIEQAELLTEGWDEGQ